MKYPKLTLSISSSPHAHSNCTTKNIMQDVCIALTPAVIAGVWFFGPRALSMTVISVIGCVFFEWLYRKLLDKDCTITDWSAVVTGMLIAMVCPVNLPYWTLLLGDFFAIIVVKQLFGGIGMNIVNPALAARAFLFSWPSLMSGNWNSPGVSLPMFGEVDAVTSATPMEALAAGRLPSESLPDLFLGKVGGSFGEISALALLLGLVYLLCTNVISLRIPLAYVGSVAVLALIFPQGGNDRITWTLYQVLSGGLLLGAIFMATDYTTSPVTKGGQIAFGIGCGVLTILLRYFGSYVEGVSFAILIMNCCVGFFDKMGLPRRFGHKKGGAAK
ncbi:MAG: RnfABCDGE type electron transport complex subunit D [Oscillospiraceae bacterium]|nr:RnfABCDGE type electron transport complex subunit D [Oscillospiraceae bacterium]